MAASAASAIKENASTQNHGESVMGGRVGASMHSF
jgi:hypothetical protein